MFEEAKEKVYDVSVLMLPPGVESRPRSTQAASGTVRLRLCVPFFIVAVFICLRVVVFDFCLKN